MLPVRVAVRLCASAATRSQFTPFLSDIFSIKVLIFPSLTNAKSIWKRYRINYPK